MWAYQDETGKLSTNEQSSGNNTGANGPGGEPNENDRNPLPALASDVIVLTIAFLIIFGAGLFLEGVVHLLVYLAWIPDGNLAELLDSPTWKRFVVLVFGSFMFWIMNCAAGALLIADVILLAVIGYRLFRRALRRF